ncbi:MAG: 4-hydroxy-tetrahydrodipicolinate synthase [Candidatus Rhabdochlamydia sp.]
MMLKGSLTALVTPFQENGDVDFNSLKYLIEKQIEAQTDGIVCCGTTGESSTLSDEEHFLIFETAVKTARNRIPIIAGTGTNNTRHTVYRTQEALKRGVNAALVVVPYYNRPTFEGCLAHFEAVSQIHLPFIIYHHPGRTAVSLAQEELAHLTHIPFVIGIKEASGSAEMIQFLHQRTAVPIYSGDDGLAFSHLTAGAEGVISIVSNLYPKEWKKMIHTFFEGDLSTSKAVFDLMRPVCESLVIESNPQGIKYAVSLTTPCTAVLRLPLLTPTRLTQTHIQTAINNFEHQRVQGHLPI